MSQTDGIGTWVWNDVLSISGNLVYIKIPDHSLSAKYTFDFNSNQSSYGGVDIISAQFVPGDIVYTASGGWVNQAFKTIEVKTAPPVEFLTILQANATYQGGSSTNQYLDETGLRQFSTKTKEYVDSKTQYQIKNIVIDESTKIIDITIEPVSGGGGGNS